MKTLSTFMLAASLVFSLSQTASGGQSREITVSAAVSLKDAFEEIGKSFEARNTDIKIRFNFGASGALVEQIKAGAPVDVFASAALSDMDELERGGLIVNFARTDFASNSVVLITPRSSKIQIRAFDDIKKAGVTRIAVGDPRTVPAGRYAVEVFRYYNVYDMSKDKFVFAENVRQVLDLVARGEVDAGVVYMTDAASGPREVEVAAAAPAGSHQPVTYPIAAIKGTKNEQAAGSFINFVLSDKGRAILKKYGFKPARKMN